MCANFLLPWRFLDCSLSLFWSCVRTRQTQTKDFANFAKPPCPMCGSARELHGSNTLHSASFSSRISRSFFAGACKMMKREQKKSQNIYFLQRGVSLSRRRNHCLWCLDSRPQKRAKFSLSAPLHTFCPISKTSDGNILCRVAGVTTCLPAAAMISRPKQDRGDCLNGHFLGG